MTNTPITLRAYFFAAEKHKDQTRKYTGEPYLNHLKNVAEIVANVGGTKEMVAAALLHDTVEDTDTTDEEIRVNFGDRVAEMVAALTDSTRDKGNRATRKALDRARLADADADVQTIKLADLIDNTSTITKYDPDFSVVYMREKKALLEVLTKGNAKLLAEAKAIVEQYEREKENA